MIPIVIPIVFVIVIAVRNDCDESAL